MLLHYTQGRSLVGLKKRAWSGRFCACHARSPVLAFLRLGGSVRERFLENLRCYAIVSIAAGAREYEAFRLCDSAPVISRLATCFHWEEDEM